MYDRLGHIDGKIESLTGRFEDHQRATKESLDRAAKTYATKDELQYVANDLRSLRRKETWRLVYTIMLTVGWIVSLSAGIIAVYRYFHL